MSGWARFLIRLYPAKWRERYGEELQALVEDSGSFSVFNLIAGAVRMRVSMPSFPKLALALSVAGLIAGFLISFAFRPTYASEAVMQLNVPLGDRPQNGGALTQAILRMENQVLSRQSLARIIEHPALNLYPEERAQRALDEVIERMRTRDIRIRILSAPGQTDGSAFSIRFDYRDAGKAQQTVQALVINFADANLSQARAAAVDRHPPAEYQRLEARVEMLERRLGIASHTTPAAYLESRTAGMNLDVLDPPSLPANPVKPNRSIFAAIGFSIGFGIAAMIAAFRRRFPPVLSPA